MLSTTWVVTGANRGIGLEFVKQVKWSGRVQNVYISLVA